MEVAERFPALVAALAGVWPLAVLLACFLFGAAKALWALRRAPPGWRRSGFAARRRLSGVYRLLAVPGRDHPAMRRKQSLLRACGLPLDAAAYLFWKRLSVIAAAGSLAAAWPAMRNMAGAGGWRLLPLLLFPAIIALLLFDDAILERLQQTRRYRIMRELDAVSRHLLYTGGRKINLHARLMRCLPFTQVLRAEWHRLTADWYRGAEEALRGFGERVGTDEARAFAETLNALRQYEDDRYYDLLRERIAFNKAKMELMRESRMESAGYLLFVLAGVPVMFTFRLFIYPWVEEGRRLFQLLD
jgi:hypothetical protein